MNLLLLAIALNHEHLRLEDILLGHDCRIRSNKTKMEKEIFKVGGNISRQMQAAYDSILGFVLQEGAR